jgi:tetratricopeptide (TPR) repeat protein
MDDRDANIKQKVNLAILRRDSDEVKHLIHNISTIQRRKERKSVMDSLNTAIIQTVFKEKTPDMLTVLDDLSDSEIDEIAIRAARTYVETKDARWLDAVFGLCDKLKRKSYQSKVLATISKELIEAGVNHKDPVLIEKGMEIVQHIGFRKYRSNILIDIIPLIIVWSINVKDTRLLYTSLELTELMGDISKRSLLHSELAKAIATIGILRQDLSIVVDAIRSATEIKQKIRRLNCISSIAEKTSRSALSREVSDIKAVMDRLQEIGDLRRNEVLSVLIEQLLDRIREKRQVYSTLLKLEKEITNGGKCIVLKLLEKAEKSGDRWYLEKALEFNGRIEDPEWYPVREIVNSSIAVVERIGDISFLLNVVPFLEQASKRSEESYISQYLLIINSLLKGGDFYNAIEIFAKITASEDRTSKHAQDTSVRLIKEGTLKYETDLVRKKVLEQFDAGIRDSLIQRAVTEICKENEFAVIVSHITAIEALIKIHSGQDPLFMSCIKILLERGFVQFHDAQILVNMANQMTVQSEKEKAISFIVIEMAKIAVSRKNRDLLQRAVGLTCAIEGQRSRSEALCRIIDEASLLAVEQNDLNLLNRMRVWSSDLLDKDFELYAYESVINGMIRYGIHQLAPHALNEAYTLTQHIEDLSLRQQLRESILEGLIRIGCLVFSDANPPPDSVDAFKVEIEPFERAIQLLKEQKNKHQIALKLARYIDIILEYKQNSKNPNYIIPLALLVLEIESPLERNAMIYRVASHFKELTEDMDSQGPSEVIVDLLQRLEHARTSLAIMNLTYRLLSQTEDSYLKFSRMCTLADSYLRIRENEKAYEILHAVHTSLASIAEPYDRVLTLADLAGLLGRVDEDEAIACLNEAIALLDRVDEERSSQLQRQLVLSIVSIQSLNPKEEYVHMAIDMVGQIKDPVEYVNALVAIFGMVVQANRDKEILNAIYEGIADIPSPYDRASMLLDVIPFAEQYGGADDSLELLEEASKAVESIEIPFISTLTKKGIVRLLMMLHTKRGDESLRSKAVKIASGIPDETERDMLLRELGAPEDESSKTNAYRLLADARGNVQKGRFTVQEAAAIDRAIRALPDRAKRANYAMELYQLARDAGHEKMADRILQYALSEASIIRPLSKRAYVLGDMALRVFSGGDEERSRDILGMAVNAAMNVREDDLRDIVFDELDVALRIMVEHLA